MSTPTAKPPVYIICQLCGDEIRISWSLENWVHTYTGDMRCRT